MAYVNYRIPMKEKIFAFDTYISRFTSFKKIEKEFGVKKAELKLLVKSIKSGDYDMLQRQCAALSVKIGTQNGSLRLDKEILDKLGKEIFEYCNEQGTISLTNGQTARRQKITGGIVGTVLGLGMGLVNYLLMKLEPTAPEAVRLLVGLITATLYGWAGFAFTTRDFAGKTPRAETAENALLKIPHFIHAAQVDARCIEEQCDVKP